MYSAMLSLEGQKVTIVGGGKVAFRKACLLLEEHCELQVIAPIFIEVFESLGDKLNRQYRSYQEGECRENILVFAATNDAQMNEKIGLDCKQHHILCNVVDQPSLSTFTTPAQVKRGALTLSVSTGGNSPTLAAQIRNELDEKYGEAYARRVALLGEIRRHTLKVEPDAQTRKRILTYVATLNELELEQYVSFYMR